MRKKKSFITATSWLFGIMFLVVISYFAFFLVFVILPKSNLERSSQFTIWVMRVMFGIFPTLMLIGFANKCFSVVKIKNDGIYKSLFGILFKQKFKWEEIKDIRVINRVDRWLFISKNTMSGMTYDQLQKDKNILQMSCRPAVYEAIKENTDIEF